MSKKKPPQPPDNVVKLVASNDQPQKPGPKPKLTYDDQTLTLIRKLGKIQCTVQEIASVMGCSERTLQNFFAEHPDAKEAHEDGKREGCASLRRTQFNLAERNTGMAIWLGKQHLGQREPVQQVEHGQPGDFKRLSDDELDEVIKQMQTDLQDADAATKH